MDDKNMREISMDEMDRVSGSSGRKPRRANNSGLCGAFMFLVLWYYKGR